MTQQYESDILAAVHKTAQGLRNIGLLDDDAMREFDLICLPQADVEANSTTAGASVYELQEGDLHDYITGNASLEVMNAIESTPAYQQQALEQSQMDQFLTDIFEGMSVITHQDLVDVVSGQVSRARETVIRTQCQRDPALAAELAELEAAWEAMATAEEPTAPLLEQVTQFVKEFFAVPAMAGAHARSGDTSQATQSSQQSYDVEKLAARVTLRIVPPEDEVWQINGYVIQNNEPVAGAEVTLTSAESILESSTTDEQGFFDFDEIEEGTWQLRVQIPDGIILLPEFELRDDDDLL
ncbi:MAG: carboxypeptidase regulatory-like domain-containing protein [Chloroflexota bacterium]